MKLNNLSPDQSSIGKAKRVGRGIGTGLGKTCGRGHKGQKARSGGYHKINFEGGQMPIQRRLPKMGFTSKISRTVDEIRLSELKKVDSETITLENLKSNGLIKDTIKQVKLIKSGELDKKINIKGIKVSKGAREVIEKLGGNIEE